MFPIPTDKIEEGSENLMDSKEREVILTRQEYFHEENFNDEEVCRLIKPILADESCIDCHDAEINDPLAVLSLGYSIKKIMKH